MKRLKGHRALVTGASDGLGLEVAAAMAAEGASIMLCGRDAGRLAEAESRVKSAAAADAIIRSRQTDVSDREDVASLVRATCSELGGLDILVANAGVYGPIGPLDEIDMDEWIEALRINLLGVVYSCREALPVMKATGRGKILVSGGGGATKPMPYFSAYAASKAGVVRFAETLAGEAAHHGVTVNVIAPGALNTRMLGQVLAAGPQKAGAAFYAAALRQKESGGDSPERAAALCVFLASEQADGITGKLISARWDPWESLPLHLAELRDSDIYTLRRITPEDRGQPWGES